MDDRKSALLSAIIKEHVQSGRAVASQSLVDKYEFSLSPATIRNEMLDLEREGYIHQLHTSAGRIPTEKGWRFYLEHFLQERPVTKRAQEALEQAIGRSSVPEMRVKSLAKALAELSHDAVFVGFEPENVYYTGLSNLFRQPEFTELDLIQHLSDVIDHLDDVMRDLFPSVEDTVRIILGKENPFGETCGTVLVRYRSANVGEGMFGILGPVRMPYDEHVGLVKYSKALLEQA